ncbi:SDR family NAD(P)-dependent oxidoreductase, partial [Streptomyces sp. NPDC005283]|uniref:type I polyketide synthase n=1 Tax=Streptomyces sp. NPDC005283 TaxID=3156871 RepID=UPI0034570071
TGAAGIGELTILEPLVLRDAVRLQVKVAAPDGGTTRTIDIHSRAEDAPDGVWRHHATGELLLEHTAGTDPDQAPEFAELAQWPVPGTERVPLDGYYDSLATLGLEYGPAFQGLTELWRGDGTAYGLVRLPDGLEPGDYGIHPALLDASLHGLAELAGPGEEGTDPGVLLPFEWSGVECWAVGGTTLRVRLQLDGAGGTARLWAADTEGRPVARARRLELREATIGQIRSGEPLEHVYAVEFRPLRALAAEPVSGPVWALGAAGGSAAALPAALDAEPFVDLEALFAHLDGGHEAPRRLVVDATGGQSADGSADDVQAVRQAVLDALSTAQRLLAEPRLEAAELVWITRGSVAATDDDRLDGAAHAAVWGLVRAIRAEHPDRAVRLVDLDTGLDTDLADRDVIEQALSASGEDEIAVRDGKILVARLAPVTAGAVEAAGAAEQAGSARTLDPHGSVLITGGTGELGQLLAHHLVGEHGVRHLVLTSRRGPDAPGADDLVRELRAAGAETVQVVSCDLAERDQVAAVLSSPAPEHPWTGVFHLAGVVDDAMLADQDAERFDRVLAPKVAGAAHLRELTEEAGLGAFVLFSSLSGVLGGPGQSSYASANAYLDAMAARMRRAGRAATSLSWGMWEQSGSGMASNLGRADLARMRRQGVGALSARQGLRALDAALAGTSAHLVPVRLELAALQRAADKGTDVAGLLRSLVRMRPRRADSRAAGSSGLSGRLAALPQEQRLRTLIQLVRSETAAVVGGSGPDGIGEQQVFQELGMDSMTSVELRRRLSAATGLPLPSTLAFDYPTPTAVAQLLLERLSRTAQKRTPARSADTGHAPGEPLAVVSMACRLPGGIDTPEGFWELLASGGDAIGSFPERWNSLDVYDPDPEAVGKSYICSGGFLEGIERFDASFFGISPREAVSMDPQQRLVLEASWEALERAGVRSEELVGSRTGVYLGTMGSDYGSQGNLDTLDGYFGTGNASSVLSGRVSYALGLQGPCMTVDTACSSSLVSLHLAAQALRSGECELALAGGVTVMSTPTPFVEFSRLKGLAADGRCKSFSALSDGTGWSEGVGVLVLKRLSAAQRDGDRVLAVIRGSAVNQDGRSQGLTAPNGPSQQRVVREALEAAHLTADDIDAIEAHGTGTSLGDPIEAGALAEVFGPGRDTQRPVFLGSSKSNIGHAQAAAGVAGVIKMVLALQNEKLPKTLHADEPSPLVEWAGSGLELLQEARPWVREEGRPRRAGVSSFGLSGTNAHVVLEEAPATETAAAVADGEPTSDVPVVVSGQSEGALREQAGRWALWLERHADVPLAGVAVTAARHRTHFEQRASVTAGSVAELVEGLRAVAGGVPHAGVVEGVVSAGGGLAVLFTGQGSQR